MTLPDFKSSPRMAVDIETTDPGLKDRGNSVYRGGGKILGVGFSDGERSGFYAIDHPDVGPEERERNERYIRDQLSAPNEKVFANGIYDLDWLTNGYGIPVNGKLGDIQIAEPLLDEYRGRYSLESLAQSYLGTGKGTGGLSDKYGNRWKNVIEHLAEIPVGEVGAYCEQDCRLTLGVYEKQLLELEAQGLGPIYDLEMRLVPVLLAMRRQGVRIDVPRMKLLDIELTAIGKRLQSELNGAAGFSVNVGSGPDLERLFKNLGLPIQYKDITPLMSEKGRTEGNPTFEKRVLSACPHPIAKTILEIRHIRTLLGLFVQQYPNFLVGDRIHCNFHQLRSDGYGTVSGRLSASRPNPQQVAGKDEDFGDHGDSALLNGQVIRKLFLPEDGHDWLRYDWSQIEFRIIAHYARGEGAEDIRAAYNENPNIDYHDKMGEMTAIPDRKIVKTFNFGAAYGMGFKKMALMYGWDPDGARAMFDRYHEKVPFVRETGNRVASKAKRVGYIKTILGRRARLKDRDKAYVMFNRLIQGSAADLMKKAMVDAYEFGVFDVLKPHINVHDELDVSKPRTPEGDDAARELKNVMENCIRLRVPIRAEVESGPNWGELRKLQ